ncbi:putative quinol monooxygenase [Pseudomonas vancouverensis]|uniref:Antibiotic biosynthesis monooxygenase n=1 Tax=Pseudomonas vancouverensis TaxID=95300 RepID=A0A1H2N140_PSEVA|nr:antibiotic biosynthesis monooxygenase [Pseudomonas vancouverensis]KAB0495744.1 antibiotic biosynthesis monooxygenase [Pseudomonas vancouverensis]TDB65546.1 antibiotic biosynthesis monooxygenase [Pseudomonas vancouverensis]SDU99229.1 Quinol monooxygenase YgiN [Pseudomonas vancouverensis]
MSDQVAFVVYLPAKPARFAETKERLLDVVHRMSAEPDFVNTWVHQLQDEPNTLVLYETWNCSKEDFIARHLNKPYRQAYEALLPELLASERRIEFLHVIESYPSRREV